jgi:hypothetical protein
VSETLESLRASFNRSLRVEGKADRTLVLYGQSITYSSTWLVEKGLPADLSSLTRDNVLGWLDAGSAPTRCTRSGSTSESPGGRRKTQSAAGF